MVSGGKRVSASSATTTSPLACSSPRFRARALPPFSKLSSATRGSSPNASRTLAAVASVEPSSSTSTSSRFQSECRMRATEATITFSSLKQGISTETIGPVAVIQQRRRAAGRLQPVTERQACQEEQPRHAQDDGGDEERGQQEVDVAEEAEAQSVDPAAPATMRDVGGIACARVIPASWSMVTSW